MQDQEPSVFSSGRNSFFCSFNIRRITNTNPNNSCSCSCSFSGGLVVRIRIRIRLVEGGYSGKMGGNTAKKYHNSSYSRVYSGSYSGSFSREVVIRVRIRIRLVGAWWFVFVFAFV